MLGPFSPMNKLALSHTRDLVPSERAAVLFDRYFEWWTSLYPRMLDRPASIWADPFLLILCL